MEELPILAEIYVLQCSMKPLLRYEVDRALDVGYKNTFTTRQQTALHMHAGSKYCIYFYGPQYAKYEPRLD
jgi:hypothetical protein